MDLTSLTGGIFNAQTLLQGNNLACFVYQLAAQAKPDILGGVLNSLTDAVGQIIGGLSCPKLEKIDTEELKKYPGYQDAPVYG